MIRLVITLALSLSLAACVTTVKDPLAAKADEKEAVQRYVDLGVEYIKRNEYSRARKHLNRALEIDPENAAANASMGLILNAEGDSVLAEKSFKTAIEQDPNYTRARTYYGAFLFSEQRFKEALAQFQLASKDVDYSSRDQIFTNMALCHIRLGQPDEAIEAYQKVLRLDRFNARALSGITEVYLQTEQFEKAKPFYERLVQIMIDNELNHSAQSLWQGIRLAKFYNSKAQVVQFGEQLAELYPESEEYSQFLKEN